jgi:O-acetylserine/cysteine efflux transporter
MNVGIDLCTGAPTFALLPTLSLKVWLLLFYLASVCTIVGYGLWYVVIQQTEVNLTGLTVFAQPVAGLLISIVWVGEALHWGQFWGSLAILLGLSVAFRPQRANLAQTLDTLAIPAVSPARETD